MLRDALALVGALSLTACLLVVGLGFYVALRARHRGASQYADEMQEGQ